MITVGVVGATGYAGVELLRLLAGHKGAQVRVVTSRTEAGRRVSELFPWLRGAMELRYSAPDSPELANCDLVFFVTPNGTAMNLAPGLLEMGVRVVDISADFRLRDPGLWRQWYGMEHASPGLLRESVYGLPEQNRDRIRGARLVANPGCYPTAVILALLPLLRTGSMECTGIIADAKSGVSGAGRKPEVDTLFSEVGESFKAYAASGHRHSAEIRQSLEEIAADEVDLTFVPHLVPMVRGIHATVYATLSAPVSPQDVFSTFYGEEPFVDVLPAGSHPETRSVRGTNFCRISVHHPGPRRVVVLAVIDNLIKGAAGQAIQNMNLMFGIPETTGLMSTAVSP